MQRVAVVSGVLGIGCVLVFGAAFVAAVLFPNGGTVAVGWNGGIVRDFGVAVPAPMPVPDAMPDVIEESKGGSVGDGPVVQVRAIAP